MTAVPAPKPLEKAKSALSSSSSQKSAKEKPVLGEITNQPSLISKKSADSILSTSSAKEEAKPAKSKH